MAPANRQSTIMDEDEVAYLPTEDIIEEYDFEDAVRPSSHPPPSSDDDDAMSDSEAVLQEYEAVKHQGKSPLVVFTGHYPHEVYAVGAVQNVFISGGGDDRLLFFTISTDGIQVVHEEEHVESVACIGVSPDQSLIASGWVDGLIKVHRVIGDRVQFVCDCEGIEGEVLWLEWIDNDTVVAGGEDGAIWSWSVHKDNCTVSQTFFSGNGARSMCGSLTPDRSTLVCGDDNGVVYFYSLAQGTLLRKFTLPESISCISVHPRLKTVLVGLVSGALYQCPLAATSNNHTTPLYHHADSVECILHNAPSTMFMTAGMDGVLMIVDAATGIKRHKLTLDDGICSACMVSDNVIVVGCSDGQVKAVDVRTGEPLSSFENNGAPVLDTCSVPNGFMIGTASGSVNFYSL